MSDQVIITIPNHEDYVALVRMSASMIATQLDADIESIDDLKIAVSEACNNVIQHSQNKNSQFTIAFNIDSDKIEIEVIDEGKGFNLEHCPQPDLDNPKESGLGIFIMQALMDEVIITTLPNAGTAVKLIKRLH